MMSRLLGVSRECVHSAKKPTVSARRLRDQELEAQILEIFLRHRRRYGSPRIYQELKDRGESCGRHRVARLMRKLGLRAIYRNRHTPRLNRAVQLDAAVPNLVERQFDVDQPNRVWLGDITQMPTRQGWLYLAANMDLYSRRIVGWSIARKYDTNLVLNAIDHARHTREVDPGLIVHTDQGSQYRAGSYRGYLAAHGIKPSMSAKGDCWDNAPMESFFKSLKTEIGPTHGLQSAELTATLIEYIENYYNHERLHSAIGYMSPLSFEQQSGAQ